MKVQTPEQFLRDRIGVLEGHGEAHLSEWDTGALAAYRRILQEVEHGHVSLLHREAFRANQRGLARLGNKAKRLMDVVRPLREAMKALGAEAAVLTGGDSEDCVVEVLVGSMEQARLLVQTLNELRPKPRPSGNGHAVAGKPSPLPEGKVLDHPRDGRIPGGFQEPVRPGD